MIKQLTGIRALLAWWVVLLHVLCNDKMAGYISFSRVFSRGYLAVDGFFVLSGFILCHVYADGFSKPSFSVYQTFLVARIARIYPVHLFMLAAFMSVLVANHWLHLPNSTTSFSVRDLILSVLLIQAWGFIRHPAWNEVAWSISAEWLVYLLFPLFLFLVVRSRSLSRTLVVSAACVLGLHWVKAFQEKVPGPAGLYNTASVLVSANFALGCLAYVVAKPMKRLPSWAGTAAAIGSIACATFHLDEVFSLCFALLIVALSSDRDWLAAALSRRVMVYLGETSFSLYMVHVFLWEIVAAVANKLGLLNSAGALYVAGAGLVAAALASLALYHAVELPARNYIRRLDHLRRIPVSVPT